MLINLFPHESPTQNSPVATPDAILYLRAAMRTDDFDYNLPPELIAQHPAEQRDASRLLLLHRATGHIEHKQFRDLPTLLNPGDLLVFNNSKVIPARLRGQKQTGGQIEFLLLEELATNDWWTMLKPAKRLHPGDTFQITNSAATATLLAKNDEGHCRLQFNNCPDILQVARAIGEIPLPPYIARAPGLTAADDTHRYQTIFAQPEGSVAAPTAGLHFTQQIFDALQQRGIQKTFVTLHVGAGTFAPVKADRLQDHQMHEERYLLSEETIAQIHQTKKAGHRIIPVGTTSLRVLESAARNHWQPGHHRTRIFIHPPFTFQAADALLTNFHLPKSTLLMLASAFASPEKTDGRQKILTAYHQAIAHCYRFFSYGDAMFIL